MNVKISVIIPVYNCASYLNRCLDSVINNSYKNLEIICVNDGSKDESIDILNKYKKNDERILVIDKKNEGVSKTRNVGMDVATGDVIAFIDADDWVHPQYFEVLLNSMEVNNADIMIGNATITGDAAYAFDDITECRATKIDYDKFNSQVRYKDWVWGKLWKKDIIGDVRFLTNVVNGEDSIFNATVLLEHNDAQIYSIDCILYCYFANEKSASFNITIEKWMRTFSGWALLLEKYDKKNKYYPFAVTSVLRQLLGQRYRIKLVTGYKNEDYKACNKMMRRYLISMRGTFSKRIVIIRLFYLLPELYRIGRNLKDPDMRKWELMEKEKRKHNKKNARKKR